MMSYLEGPGEVSACRASTGYHNATDFEVVSEPVTNQSRIQIPPNERSICVLPSYSCTVYKAGCVSLKMEQTDIFQATNESHWEDFYVELRGTLLSVYKIKRRNSFMSAFSARTTEPVGRLLKRFTLQQAEAGLAIDLPRIEFVPRADLSAALSQSAIRSLNPLDPNLFIAVRLYAIRLRLESSQILLRLENDDERKSWLESICSAIDIAPPIESRSEPRYHTIPRRRRHRTSQVVAIPLNSNPRSCTESEQNQIAFSSNESSNHVSFPHSKQPISNNGSVEELRTIPFSSNPGLREINLSLEFNAIGETQYSEPSRSVIAPPHSVSGNRDRDLKDNLTPTRIDHAREARYQRRCMPVLLYHSRRASKYLIRDGAQLEIDWESHVVHPIPVSGPPRYSSLPNELEMDPDYSSLGSKEPHKQKASKTFRIITASKELTKLHNPPLHRSGSNLIRSILTWKFSMQTTSTVKRDTLKTRSYDYLETVYLMGL